MNRITIKFWTGRAFVNIGWVNTRLTGPELASHYRSRGLQVTLGGGNNFDYGTLCVAPADCLTSDGGVYTIPCHTG